MIRFNKINFGLAAGESEASQFPQLVKEGFLDNQGVIRKLLDEHKYIVLGRKGSGKSLIGEKLSSIANERKDFFVKKVLIADFPYTSFEQILPKNAEENNNLPKSWALILLLVLINQLEEDPEQAKALNKSNLRELGLIASCDFRSIIENTKKKKFKVGITNMNFQYETEKNYSTNFAYLIDELKNILQNINIQKKIFLVVDGLDDFIMTKDVQDRSLGSLFYEIGILNNFFFEKKLKYKIVVMCRIDLFERFSIPNKNKQKQDFGIEIDWYHDPRNPTYSALVELANKRAYLRTQREIDIFSVFFPKKIRNKETVRFLLEQTRHTPRDFIQMLHYLQEYVKGSRMSSDEILSGLRAYSERYLLPEIKDELAGYISAKQLEYFLSILQSFHSAEISILKLKAKCHQIMQEEDITSILNALFNCNAIGNKYVDKKGDVKYFFKYRNRNRAYNPEETVVIHPGLLKALAIV